MAVVFNHIHNLPVAEIAEHLGRTNEAVAGLLRRGLCDRATIAVAQSRNDEIFVLSFTSG